MEDALGATFTLFIQPQKEGVPIEINREDDLIICGASDRGRHGMGRWMMVAAGKALLNCCCQRQECPRCSLCL